MFVESVTISIVPSTEQSIEDPAALLGAGASGSSGAGGSKDKRKRKLDEIVMGLSAAKEQKTFSDPSLPSSVKKQQIPPSVSVTPAGPMSLGGSASMLGGQHGNSGGGSGQSNQKPFSITVTSVPGKRELFLSFFHVFQFCFNCNSLSSDRSKLSLYLELMYLLFHTSPGTGKSSGQSSSLPAGSSPSTSAGGLAALQSMTMAGLNTAALSKELAASAALFPPNAVAETTAFIKQQQKLLAQLPPNSPQRKSYEALLNEIKQAHEYNT